MHECTRAHNVCMHVYRRMDRWIDISMDGWSDGWTDGWMDGSMIEFMFG